MLLAAKFLKRNDVEQIVHSLSGDGLPGGGAKKYSQQYAQDGRPSSRRTGQEQICQRHTMLVSIDLECDRHHANENVYDIDDNVDDDVDDNTLVIIVF